MWRVGNRPLPRDVTIDGGSDWIVLNRNYSRYLATDRSHYLTELKHYYKYSLLPAEVTCLSVCLFQPLSVSSVCWSVHLVSLQSVFLSCLSVHLSVLSVCQCRSVSLSFCLLCLSVSLSACVCVSQFVCLSVFLLYMFYSLYSKMLMYVYSFKKLM